MTLATALALRWELARFHTRESWLQWFSAVWGASFAAASTMGHLDLSQAGKLLLSNIWCMTLLHGSACIWNDIIDCDIDARVERTKGRPLPSGRISKPGALLWYWALLGFTGWSTYTLLGPIPTTFALLNSAVYVLYPFTKRILPWPQLVLAPAVGWPAFVGWTSVTGSTDNIRHCFPLFCAVSIWTIYFDTAYGFQDAFDDRKIGVNSLAIYAGDHIFSYLKFLGLTVIGLLSWSAYMSGASAIFWALGIAVWAISVPFQLKRLDINDPKSGGVVFQMNINLGGYITLVAVAELVQQVLQR